MIWSGGLLYLLLILAVITVGSLSKRFPTNTWLKKQARLLKRRLICIKRFIKKLLNKFKILIFKKSAA